MRKELAELEVEVLELVKAQQSKMVVLGQEQLKLAEKNVKEYISDVCEYDLEDDRDFKELMREELKDIREEMLEERLVNLLGDYYFVMGDDDNGFTASDLKALVRHVGLVLPFTLEKEINDCIGQEKAVKACEVSEATKRVCSNAGAGMVLFVVIGLMLCLVLPPLGLGVIVFAVVRGLWVQATVVKEGNAIVREVLR